ncbi:hypothetical protein B0O80DRAFT_471565 [Mortierella sp. GBAus27b]|nr:hypothetical protein B0O80DRAFT_471565 [Mortierella sp. GBAus27b]
MDHVTGTINSIKAHALISKATSNDPKPTPGYLFPEIARTEHAGHSRPELIPQKHTPSPILPPPSRVVSG